MGGVSKLSLAGFVLFAPLVMSTEQNSTTRQNQVDFPKLNKSKITENMKISEISDLYLEILEASDEICRQNETGDCNDDKKQLLLENNFAIFNETVSTTVRK